MEGTLRVGLTDGTPGREGVGRRLGTPGMVKLGRPGVEDGRPEGEVELVTGSSMN